MARTYTKKHKMNTITNDFTGLLSLEEMEFFPNLDLCLPLSDENDDIFQIEHKENEDFSSGEILQELDLQGGSQLLEPGWFTEKFDFTNFDPSDLAGVSATLEDLTNSSFPDLNAELTIPLPEDIPLEMPPTPEQKVPEFQALSPYSTNSEGQSSNPPSPGSSCSDNSEGALYLKELLSKDTSKTTNQKQEVKTTGLKRQAPSSPSGAYPKPPKREKTQAQRQRKRVQNKDAATRYRVKKRSEQDVLFEQAEKAESENNELKKQLSSITTEIEYLKNLLIDAYKNDQKRKNKS